MLDAASIQHGDQAHRLLCYPLAPPGYLKVSTPYSAFRSVLTSVLTVYSWCIEAGRFSAPRHLLGASRGRGLKQPPRPEPRSAPESVFVARECPDTRVEQREPPEEFLRLAREALQRLHCVVEELEIPGE
jgi:hypothetical protein